MFKELLTNKWILGGFGCLLIFATGCFLWLQNELGEYSTARDTTQR